MDVARQGAPRQGASLMLVDPDGRTLLVRRAPGGLLDGTWAFPGGGVDPRDREDGRRLAPHLPEADAAARVAAVRESVEELGLLPASPEPPPPPDALARWRERLVRGEAGLAEALSALGRTVDLDRVTPWMVARMEGFVVPPMHVHLHRVAVIRLPEPLPSDEVDGVAWWSPHEAIAKWRAGEIAVPEAVRRALEAEPPTEAEPREDHGAGDLPRRPEGPDAAVGQELLHGLRLVPLPTPTLPPATHTNAFLLGTGERRIVVDPGSPWAEGQAILEAVRARLGVSFAEVWLTHHHPDHVGGAAALKARYGIRVRAHPDAAARLPAGLVDAPLQDGEPLEVPGPRPQRWTAVLTPGHAPGHLCLFEPGLGALLVGDLMAGVGTVVVDPDEGDMRLYLASLERIRALGARFVFPAHGPPTAAVAERIDAYVAHRLEREAAILEAVRAGATTPEAVVPPVYTDVPEALHPLAARSVLAHLLKLRDEGRLREANGFWQPAD